MLEHESFKHEKDKGLCCCRKGPGNVRMESLSVEEDINICDNFAFFFSVLIFFWWGGFGKKIVFATFYPWIKVLFLCLNFLGDIFPILRLFGYLLCTPATAAPFPLDVSDNTIHLHTDTIIRSQ